MKTRYALSFLGVGCVLCGAAAQAQGMRDGDGVRPWSQFQSFATGGIPIGIVRDPGALRLQTNITNWEVTGSRPEAYEVRCDGLSATCKSVVFRSSQWAGEPYGMASLSHNMSAVPYRGQRVEFSGDVRPGGLKGWAGLWIRVDGADGKPLAFDNMQDRPLRGTSAFSVQRVVVDVPMDASRIVFGTMVHGPGALHIRELKFYSVPVETPLTDMLVPLKNQSAGGVVGRP